MTTSKSKSKKEEPAKSAVEVKQEQDALNLMAQASEENEELRSENTELSQDIEKLTAELSKAKNQIIALKSRSVDPMEMDGPKLGDRQFAEGRPEDDAVIEPANNQSVDAPGFKEKMELERFMREKVEIHILPTNEKDAEKIFQIAVNGKKYNFQRGQNYIVPRFIVEGLLHAKPVTYGNELARRGNGDLYYKYPTSTGLRYPFSVIQDANPKGSEWIRKMMGQAA